MDDCLQGRCLCGAVRYQCHGQPLKAGYCYCRTCQRATGAPVYFGVSFPREAVSVDGQTARYRSSSRAWRHFCPTCGSSLFFEPLDGDYFEVSVATLDHPEAIAAQVHVWTASAIPGFHIDDALPRSLHGEFDD